MDKQQHAKEQHLPLIEEHECLIFEVQGDVADQNFHLAQLKHKINIVLDLCNWMAHQMNYTRPVTQLIIIILDMPPHMEQHSVPNFPR